MPETALVFSVVRPPPFPRSANPPPPLDAGGHHHLDRHHLRAPFCCPQILEPPCADAGGEREEK
ncbi:hypothetical protein TIFTF001_026155 [Ficus carica]|uniref:Uncharacterized protein n=1 Tax=Ficus carica TaxID=3494 RepID=A0AA88DKP9_FICCA|nr:hypothetical protein TIFTF001_026155 [Ficus carica]